MNLEPKYSKRPAAWSIALLAVFIGLPGAVVRGQAVTPVQGLSFGSLIAGVAEAVATGDVWRRAEFVIEGDAAMNLRLVLPTALRSATGEVIPLQFRSSDGAVTLEGDAQPTIFDPSATHRVRFKKKKDTAVVHLGGVAAPAADQRAGVYTATVIVTLTDPKT